MTSESNPLFQKNPTIYQLYCTLLVVCLKDNDEFKINIYFCKKKTIYVLFVFHMLLIND